MAVRLGAIIEALGGELQGDPATTIERIAPLASAGPDAITFLSQAKLEKSLAASKAGCVIVPPALRDAAAKREGGGSTIVTAEPYLYFARLTQFWKTAHDRAYAPGIHASSVVDADAVVDPSAHIGPLCVVERGARIGAGTVLRSRVTVSEDCVIGARCVLHPGVVIGADGFGLAPHEGAWVKIEQLGAVRIGDDVEIGANTCIDRGALDDTVIEDGVKLDNLIQIGHNVHIGKHTAMAGCVGVAGSAVIGAHCQIGGAGMILGHLTIADHVVVGAGSMVARSIRQAGHYTGRYPIDDNSAWEKNAATLKNLHGLRERLIALEKLTAQRDPTP